MSTNQLHKAKQKTAKTNTSTTTNVSTHNTTEITSEQSQRLIQTMLTMSFGCLAFLRGLFPDEYFLDQRFVPEKINKNYNKNENSNNNNNKDNNNSIKIKTLVRGKNKEVDLLLDWLEKSVFQTIKLKYLKCLILDIFLDKNKPNELLENYIFKFDYLDNDMIQLSIDSKNDNNKSYKENLNLNLNTNNKNKNSLLNSRKMVQQLMRRFIIITQSLEPLPSKKFLNMRLVFNDNAATDYQPNLFKDASLKERPKIKIPILNNNPNDVDDIKDDLDKLTRVGTLNTNYHKLNFNIFSTLDSNFVKGSPTDSNDENNSDQNDIVMEDEDLQYDVIDPLEQILKDEEQFIQKKQKIEQDADIGTLKSTENCSKNSQINNKFVSQTTNLLGGYLNSHTSILPTQIVTSHKDVDVYEKNSKLDHVSKTNSVSFSQDIALDTQDKLLMESQSNVDQLHQEYLLSCECNCFVSTENNNFITFCKKCDRCLHKLCYGNTKTRIICFSCLYSRNNLKDIINSESWKLLFMVRKCYRQILRLRCVLPNPISKLYKTIFAQEEQIESNLNLFTIAISLLFHDETFLVVPESSNTNRKIFIDLPNIVTLDNIELSPNQYHFIKFNKKSKNGHSCYLTDVPTNRKQIDCWLKEIDSMVKSFANSLPSSVNLECLAINDHDNITDNTTINNLDENGNNSIYNDTDTQMMTIAQKRKNLDLDDYLKIDDSSIANDTLNGTDNKSEYENPVKIRKISVSKKTLLSNW